MNDRKDVQAQQKQELQSEAAQRLLLRPAADIYEDANGITVKADLPGVSRERLNIQVDKDSLVIEGQAAVSMPEDMEALHADLRATRYERRFSLSSELDTDRIDAQLKDGVLTVTLPKRKELQPRRIEVNVA